MYNFEEIAGRSFQTCTLFDTYDQIETKDADSVNYFNVLVS